MILKLLLELVLVLLELLFGWVSLPQVPAVLSSNVDTILNYMREGMGWVYLVVPKELVLALLPIILAVENFDRLYSVTMWILKKIPMLNIK